MGSLILDLSVVLVFLIFSIFGFRSGLIQSFLGLVNAVFSSVLSASLGGQLAMLCYNNVIAPIITREISSVMSSKALNFDSVIDSFPKTVSNLLSNYGITSSRLNHIINNNSISMIPEKMVEVFAPIIVNILKPLFTIVLFLMFIFLIRFLILFFCRIFKFSILRQANSILGGLFGFLKGYLVIAVIMCCLRTVIPFCQKIPEVLTSDTISKTVLFKCIYNNNPVYGLFKNT